MTPSITVAIPLHASARWIDNVVANVRALPPMVSEIIISDQTCLDDAANRIRARLADDRRVHVRAAPAGLSFVEHYHQLLESARGDLFMWMPHDDLFDPDWVPRLAAALAANPQAWLAFGGLIWIDADDDATIPSQRPFPKPRIVSRNNAVRMFLAAQTWVAFRGLMRREAIIRAGLRMDPAESLVEVDLEWVLAIALRSKLVRDDGVLTWKRRYPGSASTTLEWHSQRRASNVRAGLRMLSLHGPGGLEGLVLRATVYAVGGAMAVRAQVARRLPPAAKRWLRQLGSGFRSTT